MMSHDSYIFRSPHERGGVVTAAALDSRRRRATAQSSVTYDFDTVRELRELQDLCVGGGSELPDQINHARIVGAVDAQLASRGMVKVTPGGRAPTCSWRITRRSTRTCASMGSRRAGAAIASAACAPARRRPRRFSSARWPWTLSTRRASRSCGAAERRRSSTRRRPREARQEHSSRRREAVREVPGRGGAVSAAFLSDVEVNAAAGSCSPLRRRSCSSSLLPRRRSTPHRRRRSPRPQAMTGRSIAAGHGLTWPPGSRRILRRSSSAIDPRFSSPSMGIRSGARSRASIFGTP